MRNLKVTEKYNNKKLINFLTENFDGLSLSTIYKALRKKDIKINNIRVSENCLLRKGDDVTIYIQDNFLFKQYNIPIVYQDENIVVFNKPAGLEYDTLTKYVSNTLSNNKVNFLQPCHRLDRNTSGLILFAKNQKSLNELLVAFKNHKITKHYICVIYGIPAYKNQKLEAFLFKDSKKSQVYISDFQKKGYKKIITSYNLLKSNKKKNISLLDITLETGRTHQIRAHLAHIGFPIIGDGKYGNNKINKQFNLYTQQLSSYSLSFHLSPDNHLFYLNDHIITQNKIPFTDLL